MIINNLNTTNLSTYLGVIVLSLAVFFPALSLGESLPTIHVLDFCFPVFLFLPFLAFLFLLSLSFLWQFLLLPLFSLQLLVLPFLFAFAHEAFCYAQLPLLPSFQFPNAFQFPTESRL